MSEYDTTALVDDIKERGSLPNNDVRFTAAKVLAAATKELREGVATVLADTRAEHLVYTYEVSATSGTAAYRMPPRAIGGSLRDVVWVDSGGNPQPPLRQLSSDEPEAIRTASGTPYAYYLRNYHVVLVPTPNVNGTLRMPYYARPNALVATTACAVVATVTFLDGELTVTTTALEPSAFTGATSFDFVRASPGFETLAADYSGSFTSAALFEGTGADPGLSPGDYICLPGQAPVPQVPVELHGLLAARTARRLLKAVGDADWQALDADVAELEQKATKMLTPRVSGDTQQAGGSIGNNGLVAGVGDGLW